FTIHFGPGIGLGYSPDGSTRWQTQALQFLDGSVSRVAATKLQAQPRYQGAMHYAGVEDHYFVAVALPSAESAQADYIPVTLPVPNAAPGVTRSLITFSFRPAPGQAPTQTTAIKWFIGPKDFDQLHGADVQLTRAIDFGWFAKIVVPLLQALK